MKKGKSTLLQLHVDFILAQAPFLTVSRSLLSTAVKSLHVLLVLHPERICGRAASVPVFCYNLPSSQRAYLQGNLSSDQCDTPTPPEQTGSLSPSRSLLTLKDANSGCT